MCGILGRIGRVVTEEDLPAFGGALDLLNHRGPDSTNVWHDGRAILGHTRLSIIDLTQAADQPMSDPSGRYRIVYNGAVYNYLEIKRDLQSEGVAFRSDSDTEVILESYKRWGAECLDRFNGMFALAIYDRRERRLFAARDRFGVKPLYYSFEDGVFYFGSEMKALLALGVSSRPNWEQLGRYLKNWGCDAGAATVFADIRALAPGHYLYVRDDRVRTTQWWNIPDRLVDVPKRFDDRVERFRELLSDAVRLRLRNDVDTGVCLSGGMDSSAVYGFARQLDRSGQIRFATSGQAKQFRVYSISHPGSAIDEYPWVEKCVRFWNDDQRVSVVRPSPERFPDLVDDVIWHQEAPVWSSSVLAFHILYQHVAAQGTRVILEGHGGDELLGGYPYLVQAAVDSFAARGDWRRTWQASRCVTKTRNPAIDESGPAAWNVFLRAFPRGRAGLSWLTWRINRCRRRQPVAPRQAAPSYMSPEIEQACGPLEAQPVKGMSSLGAELYAAFTEQTLPITLRVIDRATMAYGLESRSPLLDYRVVQFGFSLPDEDRIAGETKRILRAAAAGVVPHSVIRRRAKLGFALAEREWFNSRIVGEYLQDVCNSAEVRSSDLLNGRAFAEDVERCVRHGFSWSDTTRIWEALNIFLWHKRFVRNPITPQSSQTQVATCLTTP